MKILASLVTVGFMVAGAFIPAVSHAVGDGGINVKSYSIQKPVVDTKLQAQAKLEYTISWYQDRVITIESGWRTDALGSMTDLGRACGLGQALPCSKMPCGLTQADFDCQMNWVNNYVSQRYGSWEAAYNHEINYHWY